MNIIALNGSSRRTRGNSMLILDPFLHGLNEAGASVDLLHLCDLNIQTCKRCYKCWYKTPGRCVIDDDMSKLLEGMAKADVWVLATSVYWGGPSSLMQGFMERLFPMVEPIMELNKEKVKYRLRKEYMTGKIVLVSASQKWGMEDFTPLIMQIEALSNDASREYAGGLLRPHAPALRHMMDMGKETGHILDAAVEAGKSFVKTGAIPKKLTDVISSELMPQALYIRHLNNEFSKALKENTKLQATRPDHNFYAKIQAHPFKLESSKDKELAGMIIETVNLMGGIGLQAEDNYKRSLDALRIKSEKAVSVIIEEYKNLRDAGYVDRWSLVYLLGELQDPAALSTLNEIIRSPIPEEKSKVLHEYSTRAEELMIRTTAVEAVKRIAENKNPEALEILLEQTRNDVFSIRRAAVQGFLEAGGPKAREKLLKVLPKEHLGLLDIRRTDVRKVHQPVFFDRTEPVGKKSIPLPQRAEERHVIRKRDLPDSPMVDNRDKTVRDEDTDKPCCD